MKGGDLLNFLRNSRPYKNITFSKLTMGEMLGISIYIAQIADESRYQGQYSVVLFFYCSTDF